MDLRKRVSAAKFALLHPRLMMKNNKYILIITHERACSTLLAHLLGSHPDICGYMESYINYKNTLSLQKLKLFCALENNLTDEHEFFLDKVVNAQQISNKDLLKSNNIFAIFLMRQPQETIKSLARIHQKYYSTEVDLSGLTDYYIGRIEALKQIAKYGVANALYIDSARLIDDPDVTLATISQYLGLSVPLKPQYQVFGKTGNIAHGDSTEHIHSGQILPNRTHENEIEEFVIDASTLGKAQRSYQDVRNVLSKYSA